MRSSQQSILRRRSFGFENDHAADSDTAGNTDGDLPILTPAKRLGKIKSALSVRASSDVLMRGKVDGRSGGAKDSENISSSAKKESWWTVLRDFVKNGLFGDGFDSHLRSERRRVRERVGPLDKAAAQINFDDEARRILSMKLNLGPNGVNDRNDTYNDYDVLYRCPKGGGKIYVGNERAAKDIFTLRRLQITRVVNCTHGPSQIPNYHQISGDLLYLNFLICYWEEETDDSNESILKFFSPLFEFIDGATAHGNNVLIHCLAGAHRAGTSGVACLMHYCDMDKIAAITAAKACRPIIDPISHLNTLLDKFQTARESSKFAPHSYSLQKSFNISHASNRQTSILKSSSMSEGDQDYETSFSSVNTRKAGIKKASSSAFILPVIAPSRIPTQEKSLGLGITSYNSAAAARARRSRASFS